MATSYSNPGGSGDRTATVTATTGGFASSGSFTNSVDGSFADDTNGSWFAAFGVTSGHYMRWDFGVGAAKVIDEMKWYTSGTNALGTWQFQGSNDASSWTNIGSSFALSGTTGGNVMNAMAGNITGYRYYQLVGVSGTFSGSPWQRETEFKIGEVEANRKSQIAFMGG